MKVTFSTLHVYLFSSFIFTIIFSFSLFLIFYDYSVLYVHYLELVVLYMVSVLCSASFKGNAVNLVCCISKFWLSSYQTRGDHLLEPFGLRLVIKVDTAHQVISCHREEENMSDLLQVHTDRIRTKSLCSSNFVSLGSLYIKMHNAHFSTRRCYYPTIHTAERIIQTAQTVWTDVFHDGKSK